MNEVFISSSAAGKAVFAPDITLGGEPLALVTARDEHGCAQACRQEDACSWFNYCEAQVGALDKPWRRYGKAGVRTALCHAQKWRCAKPFPAGGLHIAGQ